VNSQSRARQYRGCSRVRGFLRARLAEIEPEAKRIMEQRQGEKERRPRRVGSRPGRSQCISAPARRVDGCGVLHPAASEGLTDAALRILRTAGIEVTHAWGT
jgi:trimethylamine:corrinoid methyltransferase-like protein